MFDRRKTLQACIIWNYRSRREYLSLNVKVGNDAVIELHDRLYTGILSGYLNRSLTFTPHLTVGRIQDPHILARALAETEHVDEIFETTIHEVLVETIDERGESTIEISVLLNP